IHKVSILGPGRLFLAGRALPLTQTDGFADAVAEIVEFRAAGHAGSLDFHLGDFRRMERELALHAFAGNDAADGEHFPGTAARAGDDRSAKNLDSLILAFENSRVDIHRVTDGELR